MRGAGPQGGGRRGSGGSGRGGAARSFDIADAFQMGKYVLIGIVALAVVVFIARAVYGATPATYEVAGQQVSLARATTYRGLVDSGELDATKGNLVAVDGEVLEEGGGNDPKVFLNGQQVDLDDTISPDGDITAENGDDQVEPYQATQEVTPIETKIARDKQAEAEGAATGVFNFYNGVLHVVTSQGQEGITETRVGETSGKTATVEVQKMKPRLFENLHPILPDSKKLIALTFDDGPNPEEGGTADILQVLADNDVKGTFFMLGSQAAEYPEMAKKVADAGHEVASHSYSHDPDHFLNNTTPEGARKQIKKARIAIEQATGIAPKYVRPPGGNVNVKAILAANELSDGYIGWTLDPFDYQLPGCDAIAQAIIDQAQPGAIVLLHDGGGDRTQTAGALRIAIPKLKEMGYSFVTIDELVQAVLEERGDSAASDTASTGSSGSASASDAGAASAGASDADAANASADGASALGDGESPAASSGEAMGDSSGSDGSDGSADAA